MTADGTIRRAAPPVVAIVVLLVASSLGGLRAREYAGADAYHASVAAAIDEFPADIGDDWRGFNISPQPAAQELLRPNRVVQRQYRHRLSDHSFGVLIVHCRDARDMRGHYPPVCYPASGWSLSNVDQLDIEFGGEAFPAREYGFERRVRGLDQTLSTLNFFILPSDGDPVIVAGMDELMRARQTRLAPGLGAAQVQILGLAELPPDLRKQTLAQILEQIRPIARAIAEGTNE